MPKMAGNKLTCAVEFPILDDIDPNNNTLDLKFEQVPIPGQYTLAMESDQGRLVLFEGMPSSTFVPSTTKVNG
jgi:hypothetical protein